MVDDVRRVGDQAGRELPRRPSDWSNDGAAGATGSAACVPAHMAPEKRLDRRRIDQHVLQQHAFAGQLVAGGRLEPRVAVRPKVAGPPAVDGQHDGTAFGAVRTLDLSLVVSGYELAAKAKRPHAGRAEIDQAATGDR